MYSAVQCAKAVDYCSHSLCSTWTPTAKKNPVAVFWPLRMGHRPADHFTKSSHTPHPFPVSSAPLLRRYSVMYCTATGLTLPSFAASCIHGMSSSTLSFDPAIDTLKTSLIPPLSQASSPLGLFQTSPPSTRQSPVSDLYYYLADLAFLLLRLDNT